MRLVAFAYFFVFDFLVNIFYTALFASIWFLLVLNSNENSLGADKTFESVKDAAGFVDPVHTDVTEADVIAEPNLNPLTGQHATLIGQTGTIVDDGSASSTMSSLSIILFSLIKLYFILIVFSYARHLVLRSHLTPASFTLNSSWKEKVQRWMLSSGYWKDEEEDYKGSSRRL
jgi:Inositolphosphorylceramide synthase subunit Kei1